MKQVQDSVQDMLLAEFIRMKLRPDLDSAAQNTPCTNFGDWSKSFVSSKFKEFKFHP